MTVAAAAPTLAEQLQDADRALAAQDWPLADQLFRKIYCSAADDPNIHAGLAFAAYKLGRLSDAARHFADACLRSSHPQWMAFHIDCLCRLGSYLAAYRLLDLCREQHPAQAALLENQGIPVVIRESLDKLTEHLGFAWDPAEKPDRGPSALGATAEVAQLLKQAKPAEAVVKGRQLSKRFPRATGVWVNLGLACKRTGDFAAAMQCYVRAFLLKPSDTGVCANLGNLLIEKGEIMQSLQFLEASAMAQRGDALVWSNLAAAYNHSGAMPIEAEFAARKALERPEGMDTRALANTHRGLAAALSRQGRVKESIAEYEIGQDPTDDASRTAPLLAMIMDDGFDADLVARAHRDYGLDLERRIGVPKPELRRPWPDHPTIGFLTADFRDHSVSYFALPLVEQLHALGVRMVTYYNFGREDSVCERYRRLMAHWVPVRGMPDEDLAQMIKADNVDVLIDLSGHTSGHRLPVFMRRPAPLQMTWLGHPATTGLSSVDARITDSVADPEGVDHRYTERLVRIGGTFAAYRPLIRQPDLLDAPTYAVQAPPALKHGYITFGSCNTLAKYSDTTIRMWAKVLRAVPGSRLLIESPGLHTVALQRLVVQRFTPFGINADRFDLRERDRTRQYLIYNEIDISLDSYPCNGGTTTFDLLWMGVPLATRAADAFAGRMGPSLLTGLGRPEWVATSEDQFVEIAAGMATDVGRLAEWRREQRERMQASPLMDEPGFAQRFLAGVQQAWKLSQ